MKKKKSIWEKGKAKVRGQYQVEFDLNDYNREIYIYIYIYIKENGFKKLKNHR